jgi:hypothetical protein
MIVAENYAFAPHELRQLVDRFIVRVSKHYSMVYVCAVEGEVVVSFVQRAAGDGSRLFPKLPFWLFLIEPLRSR